MKLLNVRNVHEALPRAIKLLRQEGYERNSRNGPVLIGPWPVTTIYQRPWERMLFWKDRDANPFYHLYEALWMLDGRNDVFPLTVFAKNAANYSDDGLTWFGAYGYRWRKAFNVDQLPIIARRLRENPDDRRCVLQMWDTRLDLDRAFKDVPCNLIATFQRDAFGKLDLTVFCRSNDIIWGAYGANVVHFSILQQYIAHAIGCRMGTYTQISVNWHAYLDTFEKVKELSPDIVNYVASPYEDGVNAIESWGDYGVKEITRMIRFTLIDAMEANAPLDRGDENDFFYTLRIVLRAHYEWRTRKDQGKNRYLVPLEILGRGNPSNDIVLAAKQWISRRYSTWREKEHGNQVQSPVL